MADHVLVINAGSSSLKYSLVDAETGATPGDGLVERIGETTALLHHTGPAGEHREERAVETHEDALRWALAAFDERGPALDDAGLIAVGHRVVHGGDRFADSALVDDDMLAAVRDLVPLAPLHNPANIEGIEVARRLFADLPQVAVFDTAFHQTLPEHAFTYAVPRAWAVDHGIRRYGFHGTSVAFVSRAAAAFLDTPLTDLNLVVLHLGNGASATAVAAGVSVETSMGMSPLEGLVMGTRSGDVDPALAAHLHREAGLSVAAVDDALNRQSGLKGLCGDNDVRTMVRRRAEGDPAARLAFDVYCHRIRKYVGAYHAVLGRLDAVVFTGGVGENAVDVRRAVISGLEPMGLVIDEQRNSAAHLTTRAISASTSPIRVLVVPTDEEWEIAREARRVVRARAAP